LMADAFLSGVEERPSIERVSYFQREYEGFRDHKNSDRPRMERNFGLYSGVNFKQWTQSQVSALNDEKRPVLTFNYIQKYVDTVHGSLMQNPFDVHFDPIDPSATTGVNIMQQLYDYDYERGDWEMEHSKVIRDGLIYKGVGEWFIDFRHDSLGNPGYRHNNPAVIFEDPFWQSDDIKDCRMLFKTSQMTAQQIKDTYNKKSQEIDDAIRQVELLSHNYDSNKINQMCSRDKDYIDGDRYKVIEAVYMQRIKKNRIFDKTKRNFLDVEDEEIQRDMMRLQGESLVLMPQEYSVCKIFTFCPGIDLNMVLAEGDHPVQIGRLPFDIWSSKNLFGQRQGLVDILADAQVALNKKESVIMHIQSLAANGVEFVEEDMFVDEGDFQNYVDNKNKPGTVIKVASGSLQQGKQAPVKTSAIPQDLIQSLQRTVNFMQEASSVVAATQGKSEGANESGILFQSKRTQALVPLELLNKSIKRLISGMGESYFYLAKKVYSDAPRYFKSKKSRQFIAINQEISPTGDISNDINAIPRQNVIIEESQSGLNKRQELLAQNAELSQRMTNPALKASFDKEMIKYTTLPEEAKMQAIKRAEDFEALQDLQIQVQMAQLKASLGQLGQPPQEGEPPQGAREIANHPGQGNLPQGIAGGETGANNQSPSDMV
jgi:hypothetical protein